MALSSKPGVGSKFWFVVPLEQLEDPPRPIAIRPGTLWRVLVIKQSTRAREIMGRTLRARGVQATLCSRLDEALELLKEESGFDLIFLDPTLGVESCSKMWLRWGGSARPVWLADSRHLNELLSTSSIYGIKDYLIEPILEGDLFKLMTQTSADPCTPAPPRLDQAAKRLRILLAEDNQVNRMVVIGILRKHDHEIVQATNGIEAVDLYRRQDFDLVLMDVQMPELDGYQATARIRDFDRPSGRHTPVLALTAHTMAGDRELCLDAGMDDYISKPLNSKTLLEKIRRLTENSESVAIDVEALK